MKKYDNIDSLSSLVLDFCSAWNRADFEHLESCLDDNVTWKTPGLYYTVFQIEPQELSGKKDLLQFFKNLHKHMPLKTSVSKIQLDQDGLVIAKLYYYEIGIESKVRCKISVDGKLIEMNILRDKTVKVKGKSRLKLITFLIKNKLMHAWGKRNAQLIESV